MSIFFRRIQSIGVLVSILFAFFVLDGKSVSAAENQLQPMVVQPSEPLVCCLTMQPGGKDAAEADQACRNSANQMGTFFSNISPYFTCQATDWNTAIEGPVPSSSYQKYSKRVEDPQKSGAFGCQSLRMGSDTASQYCAITFAKTKAAETHCLATLKDSPFPFTCTASMVKEADCKGTVIPSAQAIPVLYGSACGAPSAVPVSASTDTNVGPELIFRPQVSVPFSQTFIKGKDVPVTGATIGKYLNDVYTFALMIVGFIAVAVLMASGAQWAMSHGDPGVVKTAKSNMGKAIMGLCALFAVNLFLKTISHNLVELKPLSIESVEAVPLEVVEETNNDAEGAADLNSQNGDQQPSPLKADSNQGFCPGVSLQPISTLEPYYTVSSSMSEKYVDSRNVSLDLLKRLGTAVSNQTKEKLVVVSALRKFSYQEKLYGAWLNGKGSLTSTQSAYLADIKQRYGAAVIEKMNQSSEVAFPSCSTSPHLVGVALDLSVPSLSGAGKQSVSLKSLSKTQLATMFQLQLVAQKNGMNHICTEWWHFQTNGAVDGGRFCDPGCHKLTGDGHLSRNGTLTCFKADGTF